MGWTDAFKQGLGKAMTGAVAPGSQLFGFFDDPLGISSGVTHHLTGGPPAQSHLGGSPEALAKTRDTYADMGSVASQSGQGMVSGGAGQLRTAGTVALQDRLAANDMMGEGYGIGRSGMARQDRALASMQNQARADTSSAAEGMLRMGQDANNARMLGMAAGTRGGNQAAAMRSAQQQGAMANQQLNQQLGVLRAQEAQQRQQNILASQQAAANAYAQRAGLGYGLAGQGLGAAQQSTGQLGQFGAQLGQLGLGQQNVGLGAYGLLNEANQAQLETDRGWASAEAAAGSPAAAFGSVLGGVTQLWGGGAQGGR